MLIVNMAFYNIFKLKFVLIITYKIINHRLLNHADF